MCALLKPWAVLSLCEGWDFSQHCLCSATAALCDVSCVCSPLPLKVMSALLARHLELLFGLGCCLSLYYFFLFVLFSCTIWNARAGSCVLVFGICCLCTESQLLRRGIYCNNNKKCNKTEEKEDDGSRFSHLGGTKQIQSGCKLCCRYVESIVDVSV